jgi:membrane protein DedA with SNARE-associated domain
MNTHQLLTSYGYLAVLVLVAVESLGIPLPGETVVIAAGVYAGSTHRLSVWVVFLVAAGAAIVGNSMGFWIGNKGGYRLLRRYGHHVRLDETRIKVGRYVFDRHGGKVVFFGRFVSVLRTYVAILAGTSQMKWRRFLLHSTTAAIAWAGLYSFGSYFVGKAISRASMPVGIALATAAVIAVGAALFVTRHETGKLGAKAEAAYPGPLTDYRERVR